MQVGATQVGATQVGIDDREHLFGRASTRIHEGDCEFMATCGSPFVRRSLACWPAASDDRRGTPHAARCPAIPITLSIPPLQSVDWQWSDRGLLCPFGSLANVV